MAAGVVGRHRELERVRAFLERPGGYGALVLVGEPGIGKTTLLGESHRIAEELGALVRSCSGSPAEATLSFAALADLLAPSSPERLAALPEPQRRALDVALLRAPPQARVPDPRAIGTGLLSLLREESRDRPLLLAVDDLQWLDRASADALEFALRRLDAEHVRVLMTLRRGEKTPLSRSLREAHAALLEIGPLRATSLARIIASDLGNAPPRPLLLRIEETSRGNPFYALELARAVAEAGGTAFFERPAARLTGLAALAGERVARLPEPTRVELVSAAVLRAPHLSMFDAEALAAAEDAGLVGIDQQGSVEFVHPVVAASVRAGASPALLRAAHRRAAGLVEAPEERARHLALAAAGQDGAVADALEEAAALARARGATIAAAELALDALRMTPPEQTGKLASRRLGAARSQVDAGDLAGAEQHLADLRTCNDPKLQVAALQLTAAVESRTVGLAQARATALEALAVAEVDARSRAGVELDVAFYEVNLGDFHAALPHARAALELVKEEAEAPPELRAATLAVAAMVEFLTGGGVCRDELAAVAAQSLDMGNLPLVTRPRFVESLLLLWTDEPGRAHERLVGLEHELRDAGEEAGLPFTAFFLVWSALWLGHFGEAAARARAAAELAVLVGDPMSRALTLTSQALVSAYTSGLEQARPAGYEALALFEAMDWRSGTVWVRWALGLAALGDGEPEQVHAMLGSLAETMLAMGFADPIGCLFLPDEIEALVALGKHEEATRLTERLLSQGAALDRAWALAAGSRCSGILAAASGDEEAARVAFEHALGQHRRVAIPFEEARTLLAMGTVLRRFKRKREARLALERADELFTGLGAVRWQERCSAELTRLGSAPGGVTQLSGTERRVAGLAAADLSNREIADRAYLSIKAVEANLTRVYRKLGIRSRAGLADALRSRDGTETFGSAEQADHSRVRVGLDE